MKIVQFIFILVLLPFVNVSYGQRPANPIISDYGTIWDIPGVAKPDPDKQYKIVIDLKSSVRNAEDINAGLNNVARMLNLHGVVGIPNRNLQVTVAIHGGATPIVLNNAGYQKKYGQDNPNLQLVSDLKNAGVDLYVCGQSIKARGYQFENINPEITTALSMLTVVTERMMDGYGLLVFN